MDVAIVVVQFHDATSTEHWRFAMPSSHTSFQVPALPADVAALGQTVNIESASLADYGELTSYAQVKQTHWVSGIFATPPPVTKADRSVTQN